MLWKRLLPAALVVLLVRPAASPAADVVVDYDPVDAGPNIASAIAAAGPGGTVTIPNVGLPWLVRDGRTFNSAIVLDQPGQTLFFEEDVLLQASPEPDAFTELTDRVISVAADGVSIIGLGQGATIAGNRGLYDIRDPYDNHGRQAIRIGGYANVTVRNLAINESGGDGIQVGDYYSGVQPSGLRIVDCIIDGSTRNGISLTSGTNVRIRRCILANAGGVWPQAGLDIEVDKGRPDSVLKDVLITDCFAYNNAGAGLMVGLFNYFDDNGIEAQDVDVRISRYESIDSGMWGIKMSAVRGEEIAGSPRGRIVMRDVVVRGSDAHGVQLSGFVAGRTPTVNFVGLTVADSARGRMQDTPQYPIYFKGPRRGYKNGGYFFRPAEGRLCSVEDDRDRPIVYAEPGLRNANESNGKGFRDIVGQIRVTSPSDTFAELGDPAYHENVTLRRR